MFKKTRNKVARILKIYSVFNVIGGIIIAILLGDNLPYPIATFTPWIYFFSVIVVSFGIYAFGEIVDLLAQIRDNTKAGHAEGTNEIYNNMPEI